MRIAIVGSRDYPDWKQITTCIDSLPRDTVIVSGGAPGVDRVAEQYAKERGLQTSIHPADWDKHGRAAGMIRNANIVNDADMVIAFWHNNSKGTANTIKRADKAGKPVIIIEPRKGG